MLEEERNFYDSTLSQGIIYIKDSEVLQSGRDSYDRKSLLELNNGLHLNNVIHKVIPDDLEVKNEIIVKRENINLLNSGVWVSGHPALDKESEEELFYWSAKRKFHFDDNDVDEGMKYYQKCGDYFPLGEDDEDSEEEIPVEAVKAYVLSEGITLQLTEKDIEPFKDLNDEDFIRIIALRGNTDSDDDEGNILECIMNEEDDSTSDIDTFIFDEDEFESLKDEVLNNEDEENEEDEPKEIPAVFKSIFYLKMKDIRNSPSKGKNILIPIYAYNMIDYGYHY